MQKRKLIITLLLQFFLFNGHAQPVAISRLPVTLRAPAGNSNLPLVLFITGDGGMKQFSASMVDAFAQKGYGVVALNALKYFWDRKTPQQAAADVGALIKYYGAQWRRPVCWLVGYSMGADVLPFIYNELPAELRLQTRQLVLLSPSPTTHMEVRLADMLGGASRGGMSVPAAINRITDKPLLLLFGAGEKDFDLQALTIHNYRQLVLPGGHHYNEDATGVVGTVIAHIAP